MNQHYYLRQNPKKKTQKSFGLESPESMKKILFRCQECGKGFRYEKCFSNHQEVAHSSTKQKVYEEEDPMMKSLCSSFSLVKKKKRSRVTRYKKTPFSCSFTTFLEPRSVFAANDEELEAAESLILLSKGSPKFDEGLKLVAEAMDTDPDTPNGSYDTGCLSNKKPRETYDFESERMEERVRSYDTLKEQAIEFELDHGNRRKAAEFRFGCLSDEQNLLNEGTPTSKELAGFLGHKCEFDQHKPQKDGEYGTGFLSNEQKPMEERGSRNETWKESASFLGQKEELDQRKLRKDGDFESRFLSTELGVGATECSNSDTEIFTESNKENFEHQCKLCNKIFSSYQALGGHQTFHRLRQSKIKKSYRYEAVEETVNKEKKRHTCNICSRPFKSVYALCGHKRCHGKRQHSKTDFGFPPLQDLGFPVFFNNLNF